MQNAVCYFFCFVVEAIILWQYSSKLFFAKTHVQSRIMMMSGLYFILFCVSLGESIWINTILYFILTLIFLVTQFNIDWNAALFHSSILTAIMSMSELIVYGITKRFAPHFLNNGREFLHLVFFSAFSKLVFLAVTYILMHLMQKSERNDAPYDQSVFLLAATPLTSIFVIFAFICIGESVSLPTSVDWIIVISAVLMLLSNLLVFHLNQFYRKKSLAFTELQLLLQKESDSAQYYKDLNSQHESQRILVHDIKKHLQSIDALTEQKEYEKVRAYIHQLVLSQDLKETSRLCDNELLNSILCRYAQQCSDKHITFHPDIRSKTTDFMADNDLTALFCNLLDNAVVAADIVPDSFIEISTSKRDKTPFIVITMVNSCRSNPFSGESRRLLETTKTDQGKHGFGIKSIRKVVNKYNGDMQLYYNDETLTFHTVITLKNRAKVA